MTEVLGVDISNEDLSYSLQTGTYFDNGFSCNLFYDEFEEEYVMEV